MSRARTCHPKKRNAKTGLGGFVCYWVNSNIESWSLPPQALLSILVGMATYQDDPVLGSRTHIE